MTKRKKEAPCLYCGRLFSKKGVYEHERCHCPKNPNKKKRSFGRVKCKICGEMYHEAGLRAHMATQHPIEFARGKANRKPSRAAKRRDLMSRQSSARGAKQAVAVRENDRPPNSSPPQHKTAHSRHKSTERPEPEHKQLRGKTPWSDPRQPEHRNASRTRDATRGAWAEMRREMSRAAADPPRNARSKEM